MNGFGEKSAEAQRKGKDDLHRKGQSLVDWATLHLHVQSLCAHSGTNKDSPVRQPRSRAHFLPESLQPEWRASADVMWTKMECKRHSGCTLESSAAPALYQPPNSDSKSVPQAPRIPPVPLCVRPLSFLLRWLALGHHSCLCGLGQTKGAPHFWGRWLNCFKLLLGLPIFTKSENPF